MINFPSHRMGKVRKNPHAVALGRLGGTKGGPARAKSLSIKRRREIAQGAGLARARTLSASERQDQARRAATARWAQHREPEQAAEEGGIRAGYLVDSGRFVVGNDAARAFEAPLGPPVQAVAGRSSRIIRVRLYAAMIR
jgi:hypothetical protein